MKMKMLKITAWKNCSAETLDCSIPWTEGHVRLYSQELEIWKRKRPGVGLKSKIHIFQLSLVPKTDTPGFLLLLSLLTCEMMLTMKSQNAGGWMRWLIEDSKAACLVHSRHTGDSKFLRPVRGSCPTQTSPLDWVCRYQWLSMIIPSMGTTDWPASSECWKAQAVLRDANKGLFSQLVFMTL